MKKCSKLFIILVTLLLIGCDNSNKLSERQFLVERFKTDKIVENPSRSGDFIIKDNNGAIWYADCYLNSNHNKYTLIFSADNLEKK